MLGTGGSQGRTAATVVAVVFVLGLVVEPAAANQDYWGSNGRIVYTSLRGGDGEIITMAPNGKRKRQLTDNAIGESDAVFSPNARLIAFARFDGSDSEIWTMRANGKRKRQITDNDDDDFGPVWSPNGKRLVFTSNRDSPVVFDLYSQRARPGASAMQLTEGQSFASGPTFSPNGEKVAFRGMSGPSADIFVMRKDGTHERNLTETMSTHEFGPAWSPDGQLIAYTLDAGSGQRIATLRARNGNFVETLSNGPSDFPAGWSPNGKSIVFVSFRDGDGEIFRMKANGQRERNLTKNAFTDFIVD